MLLKSKIFVDCPKSGESVSVDKVCRGEQCNFYKHYAIVGGVFYTVCGAQKTTSSETKPEPEIKLESEAQPQPKPENEPVLAKLNEQEIERRFRDLTKKKNIKTFSSDTFRSFGLDVLLEGDTLRKTGSFFHTLLIEGKIREVGRTRSDIASNKKREIRLYEWIDTDLSKWASP